MCPGARSGTALTCDVTVARHPAGAWKKLFAVGVNLGDHESLWICDWSIRSFGFCTEAWFEVEAKIILDGFASTAAPFSNSRNRAIEMCKAVLSEVHNLFIVQPIYPNRYDGGIKLAPGFWSIKQVRL